MNIGDEIKKGKTSYKILDIYRGRKAKRDAKKYAKLIRKNYGYRIRTLSNKDGNIHYVAMRLEDGDQAQAQDHRGGS